MTRDQYLIKRKLNMLVLAETLGNISDACRKLGVSRTHFYDVKNALEEEGLEGLLEKARNKPRLANRVPPEIEKAVVDFAIEFPAYGPRRASNELRKKNINVSEAGVRGIWIRNNLRTKKCRLKKLEEIAAKENGILTESQIQALEDAKEEKQIVGEIETHHPGFLLGQDTLYIGWIKGVGRIYQQTGIDTFSNIGFAKVYHEKTAITAADFLNDKVLPFFDSYGIRLFRVLTDRGTEYKGLKDAHPFQLFLQINDIEHTKTKARHPQTNGSTERLNSTILNEFYKVAFRKKIYSSIEEVQKDLDIFMDHYNRERTNQGKHCQGRTPLETFKEGLKNYEELVQDSLDDSEKEAA